MKTLHSSCINKLVYLGLLTGLVACSDATQFTERTSPLGADSLTTAESGDATSRVNSSQDPMEAETEATADSHMPDTDGLVYEGSEGSQAGDAVASEPVGADNPGQNAGGAEAGGSTSGATTSGSTTGGSTTGGSTTGGTGTIAKDTTTPPAPSLFNPCLDNPSQAIVAQVYPLPANTSKLPDFNTLTPAGDDVCLSQFNISERQFTEGFPGVSNLIEWFGLDFNFRVNVPSSGTYTFTLRSDDGAILAIDNAVVIDNDGLHATTEKSGSKYLTKGLHTFHLKYYQGPRYYIALELFWKTPGTQTKTYIPEAYLSRP